MQNFTPGSALAGGSLIGASAALMLLFSGRIAGISGILGGLLRPARGDAAWRAMFLIGMLMAPLGMMFVTGQLPEVTATVSDRALILSGLLVGFGTRLGNGCTSGHGVCGLARRSSRSLIATLIFMTTAALTVFLTRHVLGGGR